MIKYVQYYQIAIKQGWNDTIKYYRADVKNWFGNLVSGAVAAMVLPILLRRFWGIEMPNTLAQTVVVIISAIIGFLAFAVLLLFFNLTITNVKLYYEQKRKAELYTTNEIELTGFIPSLDDVRPCGIMITNKKGVAIRASLVVTKIWQDRIEIAKGNLPKSLRWYIDGELRPTYELIESGKSLLIALEHLQTERERGAILLHVPSRLGEEKGFGKSVGLEFGGDLGIAVFEKKPLQIEIEFNFIIKGLYLKPKHQFSLLYNGNKLTTQKIGDWIL